MGMTTEMMRAGVLSGAGGWSWRALGCLASRGPVVGLAGALLSDKQRRRDMCYLLLICNDVFLARLKRRAVNTVYLFLWH